VDKFAAIDALADAIGDEADRRQVVVEVDCGARRSGAPPEMAGRPRARRPQAWPGAGGVFTYPGHSSSSPDAPKRAAQDQHAGLTTAVHSLADLGITAEVVSAGSTPTVEFSTSSVITEIRPGEYVFCDLDNARLGACSDDHIALFAAATVVSAWVPDQVTKISSVQIGSLRGTSVSTVGLRNGPLRLPSVTSVAPTATARCTSPATRSASPTVIAVRVLW
jgi:D-serine deaminase-like pyridoxal phosphate-dependent protein